MPLRCARVYLAHIETARAMDGAGLPVHLLPRAWRSHHRGSGRLGKLSDRRSFEAEALSLRNAIVGLPRLWRMRGVRRGIDFVESWAIRYTQHQYDPGAPRHSRAESGFLRRGVRRAKTGPARAAMDARCGSGLTHER